MTKLNLKHLMRISVVKKFMKSQRGKKTNISTEFLELLQRYTYKTLVELCQFSSDSKQKKLNKLPGQFKRIKCDIVLLSRTEVNKIVKKARLQMSSKFFKEFNDHIAYISSISIKETKDITIKKMLLASVIALVDSVTDAPQVVTEALIKGQQSMEVHYKVEIQGVAFEGRYFIRSGYDKKKLEKSVSNAVKRQLKMIGVLESPVVKILSSRVIR